MTPDPIDTSCRDDDDLVVRTRRICDKILDGIEATLAELQTDAQGRAPCVAIDRARIMNEVRRAVRTECAALLCRHALCRRAQQCRRQPCAVPSAEFDDETTNRRDRSL